MHPAQAIAAAWGAFVLSWLVAAVWSSAPQKRASFGAQTGYRVLAIVGGILLFKSSHGYDGPLRLWMLDRNGAWTCVALIVAGFAFAWWARIYLGALWSGQVTLKPDHHIVDTGPYALVRHPIYTGILTAVLATMAAKGTLPGVAGAAIILVGVWMKARIEERWLRQELGAEAYDRYARRVPMLLPFLRWPSSRP
jgi:protein-S-isoprenylcysteine O-methyltransferase Ste14